MRDTREELFSALFSEARVALRRYVRRLVRSRETADEIVQEAFLRTYEHAQADKAPKAFLYSVAKNLAADQYRHDRIAQTESVGDFDTLDVVPEGKSLEAALLADERSRLLKEAVEHLPRQCRSVFALKIFHGCSYKEIADTLGISPKTVENHVAHGLRETHRYLRARYKEVSTHDL